MRLFPLFAVAALAGCSLAPKYVRPELPTPPSWPVGDAYLRQSEAALPSITYRDVFRDVRLQAVIDQALANNRDLRIAAANIASARAQYRIQRADLLPQVDASASFTRNRRGGQAGRVAFTGNALSADLGITAFEIDLFGRVRSLTRAALDRYFATEAGARATRLTLVGDVGDAWLNYAADRSLLRIAEETAANAERSVRLTRLRLEGGIAPRTDLRQAEQVLATAQINIAEQRTAVAQDVNALQLLVGAPVAADLLPETIESVAASVAVLPAGLDSGILLRRPDVVEAEYSLRAANADIGVARAELFPRISLTGALGFANSALSSLFTNGAFNYSVGPSASYPIFRAGAGRANVAFTQAQRDVALATYERTIQTAFRETADALARQGTIDAQLAATRRFGEAAADTLRLADLSYRGGITPFLNTLDAQRSLYSAQQTLVNTQLIAAQNRVALYRVLGGDATLEATAQGPKPVSASGTPRPE
jgi:multidrug efflux system outer membrane protein